MASIGKLVNGQFKQLAGNFDILNADVMTASSTSPGLMSVADKKKIDDSYTSDDVAAADDIREIFNK